MAVGQGDVATHAAYRLVAVFVSTCPAGRGVGVDALTRAVYWTVTTTSPAVSGMVPTVHVRVLPVRPKAPKPPWPVMSGPQGLPPFVHVRVPGTTLDSSTPLGRTSTMDAPVKTRSLR